jgi:hypothetical protein
MSQSGRPSTASMADIASIDHLVGADQQPFRDRQPDPLSGLQIEPNGKNPILARLSD